MGPADNAAVAALLARYRATARDQGLACDLSADDVARLAQEPCHFCRTPPSFFREGGGYGEVGRVDNAEGFTAGNCIPCCQCCGPVKAAYSYDETLDWIQRLMAHQAFRSVETPADLFGP